MPQYDRALGNTFQEPFNAFSQSKIASCCEQVHEGSKTLL